MCDYPEFDPVEALFKAAYTLACLHVACVPEASKAAPMCVGSLYDVNTAHGKLAATRCGLADLESAKSYAFRLCGIK